MINPNALAPELNPVLKAHPHAADAALRALREEAHKGNMVVWGRRKLSLREGGFSELEEKIAPEYWRLARLSKFHCVHPAVASVCRSEIEPGILRADDKPPPIYGYLRVNRAQIERLWPEPGVFL